MATSQHQHDRDRRRVLAAVWAPAPYRVINVFGPLGIGKSRLLQGCAGVDTADDVDDPAAVRELAERVEAAPGTRFVVASRRPLAAAAGWRHAGITTAVELARWRPWEIEALARSLGVSGPSALDTVVRLAGGVPLLADLMSRQILSGTDPGSHAAVAAPAAGEIVRRLAREGFGPPSHAPLTTLAGAGGADEEMLRRLVPVPGDGFDALARLSIVRAGDLGLSVIEPYRTVLDLDHGWRQPLQRRALLTRAAAHRLRQIPVARDRRHRGHLLDRALMLVDDPVVRQMLFPAADPAVTIRPAEAGDEEGVVRLVRLWARRGQLDPRIAGRMFERWWACQPDGFRLAVDRDGRITGACHLLTVRPSAVPALEPLLQQHTEPLLAHAGTLLGMAISDDSVPGSHAAVLRESLMGGVTAGRLVVSTPWPPYQQLCARVGLGHLGQTSHDTFRCGRRNWLFLQDFDDETALRWIARLTAAPRRRMSTVDLVWHRDVRRALGDLHAPARLARNPLMSLLEGTGSPETLAATLRTFAEALAASPDPTDAEAGRLLVLRYLDRRGHDAAELAISRATYFRRLRHGVTRITEALQTLHWPA